MFKRFALLLCGTLLAGACSAADNAPYTDGDQYVTIATPQRMDERGKVEVVEVFSYGCVHCAHFASYAEQLQQSLPKGVVFKLMPAVFSPAWEPYARAFHAAQQLGVLKKTHMALFAAKFHDHYPINSLDDLADFYARQGVDRAAFLKAANSPETDRLLRRDFELARKWGVDGTPTLVVDGKYRSNQIHTYTQLVDLVKWLVDRELGGRSGS